MILSELAKRVAVAGIAGPLFIAIIWVGGFFFIGFMLLVGLLIQREMIRLMDLQGFRPNAIVAYLSMIILSAGVVFQEYLAASFMGAAVIQIVADTLDLRRREMYRTMSTFYCTIYPALGVLSFMAIRMSGYTETAGFAYLLVLLLMIWGNDSLAFFVGKNFGKRLMAPALSPKKTWEGFIGGFAGSALGLWVAIELAPQGYLSFNTLWPLIIIISLVGPVGDLAASKLKRAAGVKDTSNLIPGHGGVLDRFDSLLLSAPVLFLYVRYFI